jgi:3-hydroxyacyl-[acyl-carrier-protein] dehydratase
VSYPGVCSPVTTVPRMTGAAAASVTVPEHEPVLSGHYPGVPILPGACVTEYIRLAALPSLPAGWRMTGLESGRFLAPVLPGDRLDFDLTWTAEDGVRRCAAVVTGPRGPAARIRLRFEAA